MAKGKNCDVHVAGPVGVLEGDELREQRKQ